MNVLKENLQNVNANITTVNSATGTATMTTTTTTITTTTTTPTATITITTTTLTTTKAIKTDSIVPTNNLLVNACTVGPTNNNNNNNNNSNNSNNDNNNNNTSNNISSTTSNSNTNNNSNNNNLATNGNISVVPITITCGTTSLSATTIVNTMTNAGSVGVTLTANTIPLLQALPPIDLIGRQQSNADDSNNVSLTSGISDGQRSLSAALSASSSPLLSPTGKIFGRNANGTMVATIRPNNEAEVQLYRVLQKASLLTYYDTLLEMGGDDVQQLYEAGEEEFLEIMALVGMASKPLHVRRLQKALHEWANNPQQFQTPISNNIAQFDTPAKTSTFLNIEQSPFHYHPRPKLPNFTSMANFNPTPLVNTVPLSTSTNLLSQMCNVPITIPITIPTTLPTHTTSQSVLPSTLPTSLSNERTQLLLSNQNSAAPIIGVNVGMTASNTAHQVTSSSPQLTPVLSEMQLERIKMGAEKIAAQLPQREPRPHTSKKRISRELEQIISMDENDPRRMEEIRKYSAIYGRFDCKRRPEKPLTLHEVCVNEAAAQLCRLVPALLTRRDELFPLARQIVKDAGFGHSASIARYGNIFNQTTQTNTTNTNSSTIASASTTRTTSTTPALEYESTETKKQRLCFTESSDNLTSYNNNNRGSNDDCRYNLFAIYQKFAAKPPFYLTDLAKFPLNKPIAMDFEQQDNESRFSFNNSCANSPSTSLEETGDISGDLDRTYNHSDHPSSTVNFSNNSHNYLEENMCTSTSPTWSQDTECGAKKKISRTTTNRVNNTINNVEVSNEVQVISARGNHIIAVANPALLMSPTLNKSMN